MTSDDFFTVPVFLYKCIGSTIEPFGKKLQNPNLQKVIDILHLAMYTYFIYFSISIGACIYYEYKVQNYIDALTAGVVWLYVFYQY